MTGYMHKNGHIKCMAVHTHGTEKACDCVMPSTVFLYVNVLRGEGGQPAFQPSIICLHHGHTLMHIPLRIELVCSR